MRRRGRLGVPIQPEMNVSPRSADRIPNTRLSQTQILGCQSISDEAAVSESFPALAFKSREIEGGSRFATAGEELTVLPVL